MADRTGRVAFVNRAVERVFGWTPEELVDRPLTTLMPARMHAMHHKGFERFMTTERPHIMGRPVRVPALHKSGFELEIELTLSAFHEGDGLLVAASIRDLRDRTELERTLQANDRLLAQYRVMTVLAESTAFPSAAPRVLEAIATTLGWDLGLYWEATAQRRLEPAAAWSTDRGRFGPFLSEVRAMSFGPGEGLPGQVWESRQAQWVVHVEQDERYLRRDVAASLGVRSAFYFPILSGDRVHGVFEFLNAEERAPDEELLQTMQLLGYQVGQFRERLEAEAQIGRLYREARHAVQLRDDFLAVASHELRTPITALRLVIEHLEHLVHPATDTKVKERFDGLRRQVERLERLVGGLLDTSRIALGATPVEREALDLTSLAADVADRFEGEERRSGSTLIRELEAGVVGQWDPMLLDQVVTNLLTNAFKFGAGRPVTLRVRGDGEGALLEVSDQGIGIDVADQQRIFERFERAVSLRHYGGMGLGLWIARKLVEANGGSLSVQSQPGMGTTFSVALPRVAPES